MAFGNGKNVSTWIRICQLSLLTAVTSRKPSERCTANCIPFAQWGYLRERHGRSHRVPGHMTMIARAISRLLWPSCYVSGRRTGEVWQELLYTHQRCRALTLCSFSAFWHSFFFLGNSIIFSPSSPVSMPARTSFCLVR